MALITTNGQISVVPGRKGKQKGLITKRLSMKYIIY